MAELSLVDRIQRGEDSSLEFKLAQVAGQRVRSPGRGDFADELARRNR